METLRESKNEVYIDGTLSEINLEESTFVKDGANMPCIRGTVSIKTHEIINGEEKELSIPINYFTSKYTKEGKTNKIYQSLQTVMKEYKPLSICENPIEATRVRVSKGQLVWNAYPDDKGEIHQGPRINATFLNSVKNGQDVPDRAQFQCEFFVGDIHRVCDTEGIEVEPAKLMVKGWMVTYGNKVMPMIFYAINPNVINAIENYWNVGDTVAASGKINYTYQVEQVVENQGFGEPIVRQKTTSSREFIITGGSQTGLDEEFSYSPSDMKTLIGQYNAALEEKKSMPRVKKMTASEPQSDMSDFGF